MKNYDDLLARLDSEAVNWSATCGDTFAEAAKALRDVIDENTKWKRVAERAGVCMTCAVDRIEACTDCLGTGWNNGQPTNHLRNSVALELSNDDVKLCRDMFKGYKNQTDEYVLEIASMPSDNPKAKHRASLIMEAALMQGTTERLFNTFDDECKRLEIKVD